MGMKSHYADEILNNFAKSMNYEQITKTAELTKEAGAALEAFKKDVDVAVMKNVNLEEVYTKHLPALTAEENAEPGTIEAARKYMSEKARTPMHRQPGQVMPECNDCADCNCDENTAIAIDFAISNMVKIADALDNRGFGAVANVIDETIEKMAAAKKKTMTFKAWCKKLTKMEGPVEKFEKAYNKALEEAKKEGMKSKEAQAKALEVAVGKLPKKFTAEEKKEEKK